jgi:glycosyltransferase involved in cell wall biosynthesis
MRIHVLFTSRKRYGGTIYQEYLSSALSLRHTVVNENIGISASGVSRFLAGLRYLLAMVRSSRRDGFDVAVKPIQAAFFPHKAPAKTVVVVHHIDTRYSSFPARWYQNAMYRALRRNRNRIARVLAVSQFWKSFLEEHGFSNVSVAYNFLNPEDFAISPERIKEFRERHFPADKRIYYLGNPLPKKGYHLAYEALKDQDAYFVVTGNGTVSNSRIVHLDLSYADYLCLLSVADVVVTMSLFNEGWCRVAHEAMMCGTPVIGSGYGGMGELLAGGRQIILPPNRIEELPVAVERVLADHQTYSQDAQSFASSFTHERFVSEIHAAIDAM